MKRIHGNARTLGLCILTAILLAGPAIAKTDAVLNWNEIAVNTAIGQNHLPKRDMQRLCNLLCLKSSMPSVATIDRILVASSPPWRFSRRSSRPGCLSGAQYLFPGQRFHANV